MNEQDEPIMTDAGKAYVQDVLAAAKSPRASDFIKRIAEVMQRFVWLEAERERLISEHRADLARLAIARQILAPFQDELARMGIV